MISRVKSIGLTGLDGFAVVVETEISKSFEGTILSVVGLPDAAVRESRERIRIALANSGFPLPECTVTQNLAPAHIRKEGSAYDLPMLLGILASAGKIAEPSEKQAFIGEISLSGEVRGISGVLASVITAKTLGFEEIYVPEKNAAEGSVIEGIKVYGVKTLSSLVSHLTGQALLSPEECRLDRILSKRENVYGDFSEVIGQQSARRACEIAAAGNHNLLFIGPPGTGKSMLAKRLPTILPDMTFDEMLESSKIYSVAGKLTPEHPLVSTRPFIKANQGISTAGLIGGGTVPGPGTISLAHNGVLFLDELPEFPVKLLETLRQPMEDGNVTISRVRKTLTYPANFMLVCAMNPCPCGNFGHPTLKCSCTPAAVSRYINRISGPLLDRIDLQVELPPVRLEDIKTAAPAESSAEIKQRVDAARKMQVERFAGTNITSNSGMTPTMIRECETEKGASEFLQQMFVKLSLSMRAYDKIIKVSRTIADLEGCREIKKKHIAEAVFFRSLDKKYWNR